MAVQETQVPGIKSFEDDSERSPRRQMLIALTMLLVALIFILTRDREFWFPSAPALQSESEPSDETAPAPATQPVVPARTEAKHTSRAVSPAGLKPMALSAPATSRAVLPPLEVEVVAGNEHHTLPESSNSVKVDLRPGTPVSAEQVPSDQAASHSIANATVGVHLSPGAAEIVSHSVEPSYPLLAKQMRVEGAVVLDALIGRDGKIQHLRVLSGPAILSAAAREAVQQWRFKPHLQSGQAVETQSQITVNFTIWTR